LFITYITYMIIMITFIHIIYYIFYSLIIYYVIIRVIIGLHNHSTAGEREKVYKYLI